MATICLSSDGVGELSTIAGLSPDIGVKLR